MRKKIHGPICEKTDSICPAPQPRASVTQTTAPACKRSLCTDRIRRDGGSSVPRRQNAVAEWSSTEPSEHGVLRERSRAANVFPTGSIVRPTAGSLRTLPGLGLRNRRGRSLDGTMPFVARPDHFGLVRLDLALDLDPVMDERGIKTDAVAQQSIGLGANSGPGTGSFHPLAARAADPFEEVGGGPLSSSVVQRPDPPRIT